MNRLYLDTHILVWLYQDGISRLSPLAIQSMEQSEKLLISPVVELELTYLHEIARINCPAHDILNTLQRDIGLETCKLPFATVVGASLTLNWTRDPFDRLIVAQAAHLDTPLLSADQTIRKHYPVTVW